MIVATDGSIHYKAKKHKKDEQPPISAAWAYSAQLEDEHIEASGEVKELGNIFVAELQAVIEALRRFPGDLEIICDHMTVVQGINKTWKSGVQRLWRMGEWSKHKHRPWHNHIKPPMWDEFESLANGRTIKAINPNDQTKALHRRAHNLAYGKGKRIAATKATSKKKVAKKPLPALIESGICFEY